RDHPGLVGDLQLAQRLAGHAEDLVVALAAHDHAHPGRRLGHGTSRRRPSLDAAGVGAQGGGAPQGTLTTNASRRPEEGDSRAPPVEPPRKAWPQASTAMV